jgi:4-carboxymuconolactone decarboxylase
MKSILFLLFNLAIITRSHGQEENRRMVRLAKLVIDSTHLETYNTYLKEEIETSPEEGAGCFDALCDC